MIFLLAETLHFLNRNDLLHLLYQFISAVGIYPIQQAIFMFWLKSSKDPILHITQLDVMVLISRTQVKTKEFIYQSKTSKEYDELDEE
jgi:hypothetical protein